ncbi:MAG: hypothetical protein K940chlam1_00702 [Candidatus Anoxychlamydiales bacterium]|nr:hypothetical protein [Candidatus Anoxychlamydiales bacterium]NGX35791.1 hypothetical protein [Candidatus Anoxychlamydiales bacterium]
MPLTLDQAIKNYQTFIEKNPNEIFDQTKIDFNALTELIDELATKSIMVDSTKPKENKAEASLYASTDWAHQLKIREKGTPFHASLKYCTIYEDSDKSPTIEDAIKVAREFFNALAIEAKTELVQVLDEQKENMLFNSVQSSKGSKPIQDSKEYTSLIADILDAIAPDKRKSFILSKPNDSIGVFLKAGKNALDVFTNFLSTADVSFLKADKNILHVFANPFSKKAYLLENILKILPKEHLIECIEATDDEGNTLFHHLLSDEADYENAIKIFSNIMKLTHSSDEKTKLLKAQNNKKQTLLHQLFLNGFFTKQKFAIAQEILKSISIEQRYPFLKIKDNDEKTAIELMYSLEIEGKKMHKRILMKISFDALMELCKEKKDF